MMVSNAYTKVSQAERSVTIRSYILMAPRLIKTHEKGLRTNNSEGAVA